MTVNHWQKLNQRGWAIRPWKPFPNHWAITVEPPYNEVLGTMKITLSYQVSRYIRVKIQRNTKSRDQQNDLATRGFCYIRPLYNEAPLYQTQLGHETLSEFATYIHRITQSHAHSSINNSAPNSHVYAYIVIQLTLPKATLLGLKKKLRPWENPTQARWKTKKIKGTGPARKKYSSQGTLDSCDFDLCRVYCII